MNDRDLEPRFAELREWDRRHTPAFAAMVAAGRRRAPRAWRRPVLAAATVVAVIAGLLLYTRFRGRPDRYASGIVHWQSPTAGLLSTPGVDLVSKVPAVSESIINLEEE